MGVPCFWPAFVTAKKWRQTKFARNSRKNQKTRPKNGIISNFTVSCEGAEDLPKIMEFKDLHLTESLKEAKETLQDQPGVYCMLCQVFFIGIFVVFATNFGP